MLDFSAWQIWLVACGVLVVAELLIGSPLFALLIFGIASVFASLAAWLSAPLWSQIIVFAGISLSGFFVAVRHKRRQPPGSILPFDVGARVELVRILSAGLAEVSYRGSTWRAEADRPDLDWTAPIYVKEVRGTALVVTSQR